jgi:hypothetical protein
MGELESIAAHHRIDEVVISAAYADRIPPERFDQLERYGVPVRILSDPSDAAGAIPSETGPFAGMKVAAAGNGPVVRGAPARFGGVSDLSVITDDPFIVRESSACLEAPSGIYLGLLEDRAATIRLVSDISPDVMIADFDVPARDLSNPLDAWIRKAVLPLERLAAAAVRSGARMTVISRGGAHGSDGVRRASLLGEALVRDLFAGDEGKLVIIRTDGTVGTASLTGAAGKLSGAESTVWEAAAGSGDGAVHFEPVDAGPVPDGVSGTLMEISRAMAEGEDEKVSAVLIAFAGSIGVGEHERG